MALQDKRADFILLAEQMAKFARQQKAALRKVLTKKEQRDLDVKLIMGVSAFKDALKKMDYEK
jgi:hypothetical protein